MIYTLLTGNTGTGCIVYHSKKEHLLYLTSFTRDGEGKLNWNYVQPVLTAQPLGLTGDNSNGPIFYDSDNTIYYLNDYTKQSWSKIGTKPWDDRDIQGIIGSNEGGIGVAVYNGTNLRFLQDYNKSWKDADPANFEIKGIAGSGRDGWIIFGDDENGRPRRVETIYLDNDTWHARKNAPIDIELITGNNHNGIIIYGEGKMYAMPNYGDSEAWSEITNIPLGLTAISGHPSQGVVGIVDNQHGHGILYCSDFSAVHWTDISPNFFEEKVLTS